MLAVLGALFANAVIAVLKLAAALATGKRVPLEFDGVYLDSEVHLNGTLVTAHPHGCTGV